MPSEDRPVKLDVMRDNHSLRPLDIREHVRRAGGGPGRRFRTPGIRETVRFEARIPHVFRHGNVAKIVPGLAVVIGLVVDG